MTFVIQKYLFYRLVINSECYLRRHLGTQEKQPFARSNYGFCMTGSRIHLELEVNLNFEISWDSSRPRLSCTLPCIVVSFLQAEIVPVLNWHTLGEIDSTWVWMPWQSGSSYLGPISPTSLSRWERLCFSRSVSMCPENRLCFTHYS